MWWKTVNNGNLPNKNKKCYCLSQLACYQPINGSATPLPEQVAADSQWLMPLVFCREYFYCVDHVHGSPFHGDQHTACREVNVKFADKWAFLMAYNVRSEVLTNYRLHVAIFLRLTVSLKITDTTNFLALRVNQTPTITGWLQQLYHHSCTRLRHSSLLS
jgi:hypothetical protein